MRGCKILSSLGQYPLNSSLVDQPRAAWFVDGNSKVNGQHPIFKDDFLIKEGGKKFAG